MCCRRFLGHSLPALRFCPCAVDVLLLWIRRALVVGGLGFVGLLLIGIGAYQTERQTYALCIAVGTVLWLFVGMLVSDLFMKDHDLNDMLAWRPTPQDPRCLNEPSAG